MTDERDWCRQCGDTHGHDSQNAAPNGLTPEERRRVACNLKSACRGDMEWEDYADDVDVVVSELLSMGFRRGAPAVDAEELTREWFLQAGELRREIERLKAAANDTARSARHARDETVRELLQARAEIERLKAERNGLKADLDAEASGNLAIRARFGARDHETFPDFVERLARERDEARMKERLALDDAINAHDKNSRLEEEIEVARRERDEARAELARLRASRPVIDDAMVERAQAGWGNADLAGCVDVDELWRAALEAAFQVATPRAPEPLSDAEVNFLGNLIISKGKEMEELIEPDMGRAYDSWRRSIEGVRAAFRWLQPRSERTTEAKPEAQTSQDSPTEAKPALHDAPERCRIGYVVTRVNEPPRSSNTVWETMEATRGYIGRYFMNGPFRVWSVFAVPDGKAMQATVMLEPVESEGS